MEEQRTIAYFSMEMGIEPAVPTYSGGLGVLDSDKAPRRLGVGLG